MGNTWANGTKILGRYISGKKWKGKYEKKFNYDVIWDVNNETGEIAVASKYDGSLEIPHEQCGNVTSSPTKSEKESLDIYIHPYSIGVWFLIAVIVVVLHYIGWWNYTQWIIWMLVGMMTPTPWKTRKEFFVERCKENIDKLFEKSDIEVEKRMGTIENEGSSSSNDDQTTKQEMTQEPTEKIDTVTNENPVEPNLAEEMTVE